MKNHHDDTSDDFDFDAWADARCAEYEEEADARHCLGGQNDARSCEARDEWTREDEASFQAEAQRIRAENDYYDEMAAAEREERDGYDEHAYRMRAYSELRGYRA